MQSTVKYCVTNMIISNINMLNRYKKLKFQFTDLILQFAKKHIYLMQTLNFPEYKFRIKQIANSYFIFDKIRKKFVANTPEEWVRQHLIEYLVVEKNYKPGLISVEMPLKYNNMSRRCDVVVFSPQAVPLMIVELKAPNVKITESVFNQISRYNIDMLVNYLLVSNGLIHYCCKMDYSTKSYTFIDTIPCYSELLL